MTEYIIHVGPHKTGSTYLQDSFCKLRDVLAQKGITYPKLWQTFATGHHALAFDLRQRQIGNLQAGFRELASEAFVLFSSEEFSLLSKQELVLLKGLLGKNSVRFVYYTRRWSEILPSHWQEDIKQGEIHTLPEFYQYHLADPTRSPILNFNAVLDLFASVFGEETINIISYSDLLDNKVDLLQHFVLNILHITPNEFPFPAQSYPNRSLDYLDVEIIRVLNSLDQKNGHAKGSEVRDLYLRKKPSVDLRPFADAVASHLANAVIHDIVFDRLYCDINAKYGSRIVGPSKRIFAQIKYTSYTFVRPGYLLSQKVIWEFQKLYSQVKENSLTLSLISALGCSWKKKILLYGNAAGSAAKK